MEHWINQAIHGSTTSTTSSSSTQSGGSGAAHRLADVMAQTHIGQYTDVLSVSSLTFDSHFQLMLLYEVLQKSFLRFFFAF